MSAEHGSSALVESDLKEGILSTILGFLSFAWLIKIFTMNEKHGEDSGGGE